MLITSIRSILSGGWVQKQVTIRGWVYRKREGKKTIFLLIRDATGVIQSTVKTGSKSWSEAERVTIESSIILSGKVVEDKRAPGGYELLLEHACIPYYGVLIINPDHLSIFALAEI